MLTVKNLSKVYRPKKGEPVKALDNVSLSLADSGLVFLLGKSGSGKSTLLNLLGGLDSYTGGEIIIKGKSSADFKSSDFDSYRNTFIGFIFQEFNILEDYTVGRNIGLALELQHKPADKEAIEALLKQVDLEGYFDRKPNELSGGQKQRVAIARALIKHPEMIMADEPTGALDSKTGRQVFDTLKKLSKEKLVVVVTHDRENAEIYGDRIIELADGKIIDDRIRSEESGELVSQPINFIDSSLIHITPGYKLTPDDTAKINKMLEKATSDVFISLDSKANAEFSKKVSTSTNSNAKFTPSTAQNIKIKEYDVNKFKLVKSRLPFKDSFRMGASGLKLKKVRLVFTILLSFIAFTMFGVSTTVYAFKSNKAIFQTMKDHNQKTMVVSSVGGRTSFGGTYWTEYDGLGLSADDIAEFERLTGNSILKTVFKSERYSSGPVNMKLRSHLKTAPMVEYAYFATELSNLLEMPDTMPSFLTDATTGNKSKLPENYEQIAISDWIADSFVEYGYKNNATGTGVDINSYNDLIGKSFKIENKTFEITGVYKTDIDKEQYANYKVKETDMMSSLVMSGFSNLPVSMGFVKSGFAENVSIISSGGIEYGDEDLDNGNKYMLSFGDLELVRDSGGSSWARIISKLTTKAKSYNIYYGDGNPDLSSLTGNNIILPAHMLNVSYTPFDSSTIVTAKQEFDNLTDDEKKITINKNGTPQEYNVVGVIFYDVSESENYYSPNVIFSDSVYESCVESDNKGSSQSSDKNQSINLNSQFGFVPKDVTALWSGNSEYNYYKHSSMESSNTNIYWKNNGAAKTTLADNEIIISKDLFRDGWSNETMSDAEYKELFDTLSGDVYFGKVNTLWEKGASSPKFELVGSGKEFKIVGMDMGNRTMVNDSFYSYLYEIANAPKSVMIALSDDWSKNQQLFDYLENSFKSENRFETKLKPVVIITPILDFADNILGVLKTVFLYLSIAFSVFAGLLFMNFIGVSITAKKKDIGVLRAIGARSADVFKIFFYEGILIGLINFVLTAAALIIGSVLINKALTVSIMVPGILQFAMVLGLVLLVVFVATYVPVRKIARKKPIDAINNR